MRYCSVCGTALPDTAMFCSECGGAALEVPSPVMEQPPVKKKKLGLLLGIIVAVVVIAAAVVVGYFTNWFGLGAPLNGLTKAMDKTLAADSMTMKMSVKYTYDGEEIKSTNEVRLVLDKDKEKIYYVSESDSGYVTLFDDGDSYVYITADSEDDYDYAYIEESEESAGEKFFDSYDEIYDGKKIDWEALVEENDWEQYIKANKLAAFVEEFNKECLSDSEWLEKYLDFEKDGNTYTFEPNMKRLSKELIDIVEDTRAFTDEGKSVIVDELDDLVNDDNAKLRVVITVKSGYVSKISVKAEAAETAKMEYTIEIFDVNETTITNKEMNSIREKVGNLIAENTCSECGEELWWLDEDDYHGDCSYCDKHDDLSYTYDGKPCCYSCYWDRSNGYGDCEKCGEYGKLYDYEGQDICYSCNYDATHTCERCGDTSGYYSYGIYDVLCWDCYYDYKYGY